MQETSPTAATYTEGGLAAGSRTRARSKRRAVRLLLAASVPIVLAGGFGFGTSIDAPATSIVLVDAHAKTYFAPPCLPNPGGEGITTLENAVRMGFEPDARCAKEGGFIQKGRSLFGSLSERTGLVEPLPSRWNKDGSWNW